MRLIGLDLSSLSGERATRGIGIYAQNFTRALIDLINENQTENLLFYFLSFNTRNELEKRLGAEIPKVVTTGRIPGGQGRLGVLLGHQLGLPTLATRYRLDALHSLGFGVDPSQPGLPALLPFTHRLTTMHDLIPLHYPEIFLQAQRKRLWYKLMLHRAANSTHIMTNSEHTRQDVIATLGVEPQRITCTPFAADQFNANACQELALPASVPPPPFVLAISGPQPHKNLARLLEAFVSWQKEANPAACLVITGAGPSRMKLNQEIPAELQERIVWLDNLTASELKALYQHARFLVMPSLSEGFGLPVLEAMQLGCAVLCSQAAGLPEVGGEAVCYVDPLAVSSIAQGLAKLWNDRQLRERLSIAGRQQAAKFAWRRTAEQTLQIYRDFKLT